MASGLPKAASFIFLLLNLFLYEVVMVAASWAVNHGIETSYASASSLPFPAHLFPIYFPMGNLATGFFVTLSLLVSVLGVTTSLTGIYNVIKGTPPYLHAAAASSVLTWALTLLAFGFSSKEIDIGSTGSNLCTIESVIIILSLSQSLCMGSLHASATEAERHMLDIGRL
ncbi:hypothetical protein Droror1_Dr00015560 [Drosera rotundifolia]